jgi:exopolysaccharide production negative regulator
MRISDELARVIVIGLGLGLSPAVALDGTPSDGPASVSIDRVTAPSGAPAVNIDRLPPATTTGRPGPAVATPSRSLDGSRPLGSVPGGATAGRAPVLTPVEAFRSGTQALRAGEKDKAVTSLQYAAEQGHALAQWKLGRMYAEGDGVERSDLRAFEYFRRIADAYADDSPGTPQARFVANAFVALGHYYLDGIPDSAVKADPVRAHEMFSYAASYFGDPDAQYYLARLYLDGKGAPRDARQAARWLSLAANKGQHQAQALLGRMLFKGEAVPRQIARGLMWLTLARDSATVDEKWIAELYDSAFRQATDDERATALVMLERWIKGRRD